MKRMIKIFCFCAICGVLSGGNVCASGQPETENMEEESVREFSAADLSDLLLKTREAVYESTEITEEQIIPYDKPAEGSFIENLEAEKEIQKEAVSYEHAGYQVRVHFNGDKTLSQCIQNLAERKIAG